MLLYVQHAVASFVSLLFGAEQVVYSLLLEYVNWQPLPALDENIKVAGRKTTIVSWKTL